MYFKRLAITEFVIDISKSPNKKTLIAALNSSKAFEKFGETVPVTKEAGFASVDAKYTELTGFYFLNPTASGIATR